MEAYRRALKHKKPLGTDVITNHTDFRNAAPYIEWQKFASVYKKPASILKTEESNYPDNEGSIFLRNEGQSLPDYTASHPARQLEQLIVIRLV
jgi:hypothetical protein